MSKATIKQRIEAALLERGEQRAQEMAGCTKWSRNFRALREAGCLVPAQRSSASFWFVGVNGSLRFGITRKLSRPVNKAAKAALIEEGEAALQKR